MDIKDLTGRVIEELHAGITGGSAELPLPSNMVINWLMPGLPFHESAFDFAISGPYAGPGSATLEEFERIVDMIAGDHEGDGADMDRDAIINQAKLMYQQNLLGGYEMWSRLVDFLPITDASTEENSQWTRKEDQGKNNHTGIVYGQAGQTLSAVYKDTLERCEVADEPLTQQQQELIDRMRVLLQEEVEVEDFLTGETKTEIRESRAMQAYKVGRTAYENAVTDYASRLARANSGSAADLIEWSRSGGIYRERANQALSDWKARYYKEDIETAQATISHITGGSMVQWKNDLLQSVQDIENNSMGAYGYPFFPATVIPGTFARSDGWTKYSQKNLERTTSSSTRTRSGGGSLGFTTGIFSVGGTGGKSKTEHEMDFKDKTFGMEFEYTQVEIVRPAFNPNFFLSRGWRPRDEFIADHGPLHSNGEENPEGAFIGYPTKALFIRNLKIYNKDVASFMRQQQEEISGGAVVGIGPFIIGGNYAQSDRSSESNLQIDESGITVKGMQLVAFISALFPYTANPNPDVENWI